MIKPEYSDSFTHPRSDRKSGFVSVLSGKGGVGKSVLALNLAERLASAGIRTLLVDADFAFGNLHILANVRTTPGVQSYLSGQCSLRDAVVAVRSGLDMMPVTERGAGPDHIEVADTVQLLTRLRRDTAGYDLVVFDPASGVSKAATAIAYGCDLTTIVLVPELTSISDAYGLIKYLLSTGEELNYRLVLNRLESNDEAQIVSRKFGALCEQFLNSTPTFLGFVTEDPAVRRAVARQRTIADLKVESIALNELSGIAQRLATALHLAREAAASPIINEMTE